MDFCKSEKEDHVLLFCVLMAVITALVTILTQHQKHHFIANLKLTEHA